MERRWGLCFNGPKRNDAIGCADLSSQGFSLTSQRTAHTADARLRHFGRVAFVDGWNTSNARELPPSLVRPERLPLRATICADPWDWGLATRRGPSCHMHSLLLPRPSSSFSSSLSSSRVKPFSQAKVNIGKHKHTNSTQLILMNWYLMFIIEHVYIYLATYLCACMCQCVRFIWKGESVP